ncbi:MAG TPA: response regulator [Bryobacteraceae bacterium]|nr:response regulator [Bryobacteraceae bacterium]
MRTVLIVDDTDLCSEALEVALTRVPGVEVRAVATAEEALQCLGDTDICALVTDLHLPAMSGFELIEAVRSRPPGNKSGGAALPILVISGDSDPRTPSRLAGLGVSAYFPKPYSPAEVRSKLEQLIDAS